MKRNYTYLFQSYSEVAVKAISKIYSHILFTKWWKFFNSTKLKILPAYGNLPVLCFGHKRMGTRSHFTHDYVGNTKMSSIIFDSILHLLSPIKQTGGENSIFFNRPPQVLAVRVIIWLVKKSSVFQKIVVNSQVSLRATTSLPAEIDAQKQNQKQKNSCDHSKRY